MADGATVRHTSGVPLASAPVVAHVVRNDTVESVHHGIGVITGPDGSITHAVGDPTAPIFARSSNKPLQALAMLRGGLDVSPAHLALACASHSGEPYHLDGVRAMLSGAGLTPADLQNTPDLPWRIEARDAWLAEGRSRESIAQNCSGKHAAMLATCVVNGWDTASYRDPQHPLQRLITATLTEMQGAEVSAMAVDGCGAPVHQLPLAGLAQAYGRLAAAEVGDQHEVATAMRTHPDLVGGTGREVTDLMVNAPDVVAKDGAEGVLAIGLPDGHGLAVKILDGAPRAARVFAAALLGTLGTVPPAAIARLADAPVLGHGEPVGRVLAVVA